MSGHPPCHRVDRVADLDPARLEQIGQLPHVVLGLRYGHAVTGNEDDLVRVGEHHRDVVGGGRANGAAVCVGCGRRGARTDLAEGAEEHVRNRPVHRPAHQDRQQRSRGAHEHAAHDQHVVLELEACRGCGDAGKGVQQRDHDRHVGAPDREHEEDAEEQRAEDHGHDQPLLLRAGNDPHPCSDDGREEQGVDGLLTGIDDRPSLDQLLQLREGDHRARERNRTDQCREDDRDADVAVQPAGVGSPNVKLAERDQGRRAAADAVEQRHHLRYCRHLHAPRRNGSEAPADGHTDDDLPVADHRLLREGDRDRDQHPNRADPVSAPRGRRVREELQRQDEGDDRRQVGEVSRYLAQCHLIASEEPPACSSPPSRLRRRGPSALLRAARAF